MLATVVYLKGSWELAAQKIFCTPDNILELGIKNIFGESDWIIE